MWSEPSRRSFLLGGVSAVGLLAIPVMSPKREPEIAMDFARPGSERCFVLTLEKKAGCEIKVLDWKEVPIARVP